MTAACKKLIEQIRKALDEMFTDERKRRYYRVLEHPDERQTVQLHYVGPEECNVWSVLNFDTRWKINIAEIKFRIKLQIDGILEYMGLQ